MSDNRPKKLYKYAGLGQQTLANLKNQALFFQHVQNFNDPFEEMREYKYEDPNKLNNEEKKDLQLLFCRMAKDRDNPEFQEYMESLEWDDFYKKAKQVLTDPQRFTEIVKTAHDDNTVTCFSATNKSILMWSHYGADHKGICLEFDPCSNFFDYVSKVEYPPGDDRRLISLHDVHCRTGDLFEELMTTKSKVWEYEKEWRMFHREKGVLQYPKEALTGVYFGARVDETLKDIVCLTLQKQNPDVKFHQGKLSSTKYEVGFTEFEFTDVDERKDNSEQAMANDVKAEPELQKL
ncbi:MAG: DUF2971 domain-containing protein [Lentisphaeraceae bacterium]|nr:DUF2971 domain-containing protein [Lentisphaeraceae bacterium]